MSLTAKFSVAGTPVGKGRPRFTSRGGFSQAYTPKKTASYEALVRLEYERQCGGVFFEKGTPIRMEINAYLDIPKSTSKTRRNEMIRGERRPLKKADSSNILKCIEDGLNEVAYHDDVQIVETVVNRYYGERPRVEVVIEQCGNIQK